MGSSNFVKNDYVIEKTSNLLFFVVKKDINNIVLRREKDDELLIQPIHYVNAYFSKIDYETAKILYADENQEVTMENRPQTEKQNVVAKRLKNAVKALKGELV